MKKRKLTALLLAFMLVGAMVTACTGDAPATDTPATDESATADTQEEAPTDDAPDSENEPVTLTFHVGAWEADEVPRIAITQNAIQEFMVRYPHVTVEIQTTPMDAWELSLMTAAMGGEMSDLFEHKGSMTPDFSEMGVIAPLNGVLDANPEWRDMFLTGMFNEFTFNENIYAVPYQNVSVNIVFYNQAILAEVGYDSFPETWSEFVEMSETIRDTLGITPAVVGNNQPWNLGTIWFNAINEMMVPQTWFDDIQTGDAAFTDPEVVQALQLIRDFYVEELMNQDVNSMDVGDQLTLFMNEEAAFFFQGSWEVHGLVENLPEDLLANTRLAPVPFPDGGRGAPMSYGGGSGWAYAISSNAMNDPIKSYYAVELLKAITSEQVFASMVEEGQLSPANIDMDLEGQHPLFIELIELLGNGVTRPIYDTILRFSIIEALHSGMQEMVIGVITPEELAQRTQSALEDTEE